MKYMAKILFFSGSLRRASLNQQIAAIAAEIAKNEPGIEPILFSLNEFDLPIYNSDIEENTGIPKDALKLKKLFYEAKGLYITSPEYNSTFSSALKNAIDWISRPTEQNEMPLSAFRDKYAAIASASVGYFGGIRGLQPLRQMLSSIMINVIANQIALPKAGQILDKSGNLTDNKIEAQIKAQVQELCQIVHKLNS